MALHVALALVAVLMLVAASMVALSSMNLNLTTAYTNGQVALNEAEAGVSKLMYVLNDNPQYGFPGSSSTSPPPPDVEIHGRLTSGFTDSECFHWVTFRRDRGVPWSVNNYDGTWGQGYSGRTVPKAMINAFSTGYCRGQYRTIELVVEHPPFPYALATSGRIQSATSLIVHGTASSSAFETGDTARPGHVVSNFVSADPTIASIVIGTSGSTPTNITGFVQAGGAVRIAQPAVVRGGVFANAAALRLPAVDVRTYKNQGQEGVATIYSEWLGAQTLDIMYYCGHNLTVDGGITLQNGFLYVDGGLTVKNGGIKGVGAIVVDGDVLVQGDESFSASHRVALLASGDVTLQGNGNFLQGLVYAGGSVSAKKLTVLGNVVVNSPDPAKGSSVLDQVRIVSNPEAASLQFTATSSVDAKVESTFSDDPYGFFRPKLDPYELDTRGANPKVGFAIKDSPSELAIRSQVAREVPKGSASGTKKLSPFQTKITDLSSMSTSEAMETFMKAYGSNEVLETLSFTPVPADKLDPQNQFAGALASSAQSLKIIVDAYQQDMEKLAAAQAALDACQAAAAAAAAAVPPRHAPDCSGCQATINAIKADMQSLSGSYQPALKAFFTALVNYYKAQTKPDGRYDVVRKANMESGDNKSSEIRYKKYDFDVNTFLPIGEGMKVVVWHVHHLIP